MNVTNINDFEFITISRKSDNGINDKLYIDPSLITNDYINQSVSLKISLKNELGLSSKVNLDVSIYEPAQKVEEE